MANNATAYGFSISVTAAYGLVSGSQGMVAALETVSFAIGATLAFVLVGVVFVAVFRRGSLDETGQVAFISGVMDLVSVAAAVSVALGLSGVAGIAAWPLTGFGTVVTYLLVSGLDIVAARFIARHTSFGRRQ